jgi:hypothetical protein
MTGAFIASSRTGGLPISSVSTQDAIRLMHYVFQLSSKTDERLHIWFDLGESNKNGWGLEKSSDGYCFWLSCRVPINGFVVRPGFWAYKQGAANESCRWYGGGDFAWRPKRLFLTFDVAEKLVLQLYRGEPIHYDPEHWENTDDCALDAPSRPV